MSHIMRGFLVLILIAFLSSSFASAAHAFDLGDCNPQTQVSGDTDTNTLLDKADTDSKAPCLDCHHCCVSHVLPQNAAPIIAASVDTPLNPLRLVTYTGEYYGSLLRPPKSLA